MYAGPVNYDQAAGSYAVHRQVHSGVLQGLYDRGGLVPASTVLLMVIVLLVLPQGLFGRKE